VREIFEETGVHAAVERVLAVEATRRIEYPNGDRSVYLDVAFVCRPTGGTARVNDDESVDVGWFPLRELPALSARQTTCVRHYLEGHESAWFARP
jgi:8-oxo-dGTP pyrophosphatase MutT (NUDIX family)